MGRREGSEGKEGLIKEGERERGRERWRQKRM